MAFPITSYFELDINSYSTEDRKTVRAIRDKINSFQQDDEIEEWIYNRRQSSEACDEDLLLFNIPLGDRVQNYTKTQNKFYRRSKSVGPKQAMENIAEYMKHGSKIGKAVGFIADNAKAILITVVAAILVFIIAFAAVYASGVVSSTGKTPFVLCGTTEDENNADYTGAVAELDPTQAATIDYAANSFVQIAKSHNWKEQAIVGVLSYILGEGAGMGTFTYSGYYAVNGPSGEISDTKLDNQVWLDWINAAGKTDMHDLLYSDDKAEQYSKVGIGLLQLSDVWSDENIKTSYEATNLISYAIQKNTPWQDPATQIGYYFTTILYGSTAFDGGDVDPTFDELTSEEWARRTTAGLGIPSMNYTDDDDYMDKHLVNLKNAQRYYDSSSAATVDVSLGVSSTNSDPCAGASRVYSSIGNSTIAEAAVTLAAGDTINNKIYFDVWGYNSTNLQDRRLVAYRSIKEQIFPGDQWFASCDRGVSTAVRWSGADDTYPIGNTTVQYAYLSSGGNGKWEYVGEYGSDIVMQPGDVLITHGNGHTKMYVGDVAQTRFPGTKVNMYSASFADYFPYIYEDAPGYDKRPYSVFRNVKPDNNGTYALLQP